MRLGATLFLLLLALAPLAPGQKILDKDFPPQHPKNDPYTRGADPELVSAAGYVSMGGFEFGPPDETSETVQKYLAYLQIRWIETPHFEIGVALPRVKVTQDERDKIRAELEKLQSKLPDVEPKTRYLDPWLRAHLYAQRLEELYAEFTTFLGVTDADFPDGTAPWDTTGKYMGQGPYLGEKGKYEVLLLPSEGASRDFLRNYYGLTTKLSQRWNVIPRDTLQLVVHITQGKLKVDESLHGHVAFNLVQMFINGYKHYSYESPVWLKEGLAHWFERRINPRFNTFDSSEGSVADMTSKWKWEGPTLKLVRMDDAPRMAQLVALKGYAELELDHHFTTWSMVDYLTRVHPEFLPALLDRIKGLYNEQFIDDGSTLDDVHRAAFKELLGMTYAQFDEAWRTWVVENYGAG